MEVSQPIQFFIHHESTLELFARHGLRFTPVCAVFAALNLRFNLFRAQYRFSSACLALPAVMIRMAPSRQVQMTANSFPSIGPILGSNN